MNFDRKFFKLERQKVKLFKLKKILNMLFAGVGTLMTFCFGFYSLLYGLHLFKFFLISQDKLRQQLGQQLGLGIAEELQGILMGYFIVFGILTYAGYRIMSYKFKLFKIIYCECFTCKKSFSLTGYEENHECTKCKSIHVFDWIDWWHGDFIN
ncbi:MAG: hypothetical protein ACLGGV_00305 [Bacteroidia bacterium]